MHRSTPLHEHHRGHCACTHASHSCATHRTPGHAHHAPDTKHRGTRLFAQFARPPAKHRTQRTSNQATIHFVGRGTGPISLLPSGGPFKIQRSSDHLHCRHMDRANFTLAVWGTECNKASKCHGMHDLMSANHRSWHQCQLHLLPSAQRLKAFRYINNLNHFTYPRAAPRRGSHRV